MTKTPTENGLESHASSEHQRESGVITVVLTAENHLGYSAFGQSPRKREALQERLRAALRQATDFALQQQVDLFIQAGDLFDTSAPSEVERSFVAERLSELKQAGVQVFALGGIHDTPTSNRTVLGGTTSAPQMSYERLGALHYFPPTSQQKLEPVFLELHEATVGICGLSVLAEQEGDPLEKMRVQDSIDRATIPLLILHAPIEGLEPGSAFLNTRAVVSRETITEHSAFRFILAGYHHRFARQTLGEIELVVAGTTQHVDFSAPDETPGFVYLGIAADGIRWCEHISVNSLALQLLRIPTSDLWPTEQLEEVSPTERIFELLRPLCTPDTLLLLRLEGELSRTQYHQLDLNQIRHYGEEHCFALAIDDSALSLLPEQEAFSPETGERFSPREELITLADELIADAFDEHEKKIWRETKEELLQALDDPKGRR